MHRQGVGGVAVQMRRQEIALHLKLLEQEKEKQKSQGVRGTSVQEEVRFSRPRYVPRPFQSLDSNDVQKRLDELRRRWALF